MLKKASSIVLAQCGLATGTTRVLARVWRAREKMAFLNIIEMGI